MNFELNEEQSAIADSLARVLGDHYSFEKRRALVASGQPHDEAAWRALVQLGVTALLVPEAHGGFGGGARDLLPVMQALGRSLCMEPFLASAVLAATALRTGASEDLQAKLLPAIAGGEICAWAHDEPAGRHAPVWVETTAERRNGRWGLTGTKGNVLAAGQAKHFIVSARVSGAAADAEGCALFLVAADAPGLVLRQFRFVDDTAAGELTLQGAAAEPLADPYDSARSRSAIASALDMGIAAACADTVGAMQAAFDLAMDYLRTRKQFGRFIGENQALRHRASEMLVALEMAKSMAMAAAVAVDDPRAEDSAADLLRAKICVGRNARLLAHGAIQLHGGIGMTEEYAVGHSLRRIHVLDQLFGDSDAHAIRLAALS